MKKFFVFCFVAGLLAACNNEGGNTANDAVDSLEARKDTLLENVDSMAERKIDSIESRASELKEQFDSTYDAKKDSLAKKD